MKKHVFIIMLVLIFSISLSAVNAVDLNQTDAGTADDANP